MKSWSIVTAWRLILSAVSSSSEMSATWHTNRRLINNRRRSDLQRSTPVNGSLLCHLTQSISRHHIHCPNRTAILTILADHASNWCGHASDSARIFPTGVWIVQIMNVRGFLLGPWLKGGLRGMEGRSQAWTRVGSGRWSILKCHLLEKAICLWTELSDDSDEEYASDIEIRSHIGIMSDNVASAAYQTRADISDFGERHGPLLHVIEVSAYKILYSFWTDDIVNLFAMKPIGTTESELLKWEVLISWSRIQRIKIGMM